MLRFKLFFCSWIHVMSEFVYPSYMMMMMQRGLLCNWCLVSTSKDDRQTKNNSSLSVQELSFQMSCLWGKVFKTSLCKPVVTSHQLNPTSIHTLWSFSLEAPPTGCSNLLFADNSQTEDSWFKEGRAKAACFRQRMNWEAIPRIILSCESWKASLESKNKNEPFNVPVTHTHPHTQTRDVSCCASHGKIPTLNACFNVNCKYG